MIHWGVYGCCINNHNADKNHQEEEEEFGERESRSANQNLLRSDQAPHGSAAYRADAGGCL